jgi:hypothetical protein
MGAGLGARVERIEQISITCDLLLPPASVDKSVHNVALPLNEGPFPYRQYVFAQNLGIGFLLDSTTRYSGPKG